MDMDRMKVASELLNLAKELVAKDWRQGGREWLESFSQKHFNGWLKSKEGQKWKENQLGKASRRKSPYAMGFYLPQWHHDAIEALSEDDEETFKAIRNMYFGREPTSKN
jgi:hypothetical protein